MRRLKSGAVLLLAACLILMLAIGTQWLASGDPDASEPAASDLSCVSERSDPSDVFDASDVSDLIPDGDVDGDGEASMKDVLLLRMFIARMDVTLREASADVYTDGSVDMKDVMLLRQYVARWDVHFGPPHRDEPDASEPDEEMRAVWVAYYEVAGLMKWSEDATRDAIDAILDNCRQAGANTVVFHVRGNSDAFYDSSVFPPNRSVQALIEGGFDPLTYAVSAAHERGMQLHAWVNPYRIGATTDNARCDDYFAYNGRYYYNPASAEARALVLSGIEELLTGYDIDGIHFDDYFYPDGISEQPQPFDVGYTDGDLDVWRREQVATLILDTYALVHEQSDTAVFGISPAANLHNNLTRLYADVPAWMAEGCLDYVCPQVYYGFRNAGQPFEQNVADWCALPRADGVRLYVGLALYKAGLREDQWAGETGKTEWLGGGDILARQVRFLRSRDDVDGFMLFSYGYLMQTTFSDDENDLDVAATEIQNLLAEIRA